MGFNLKKINMETHHALFAPFKYNAVERLIRKLSLITHTHTSYKSKLEKDTEFRAGLIYWVSPFPLPEGLHLKEFSPF